MARHPIGEVRVVRFLFADTRMAWFWFLIRLYVGYEWFVAGLSKISNPVWVGSEAGSTVTGFLTKALSKAGGEHPDVQAWYASFIEHVALPNSAIWSHTVAYGEFLVGAGLIFGAFVGLAAFFGAFMNLNYLLAGTVSLNPVLLTLSVFLILAWRIAGYWGADYFLLKHVEKWRIRKTGRVI